MASRPRNIRRLTFVAAAAGVLAFSFFWGRHVEPPARPLTAERVALLVGAAERPEYVKGRYPYWRVNARDSTFYAAESRLLAPDARGYGGPLNLLVVLDADGKIDRLILLSHRETPSFLEGLDEFLASFSGRLPQAPLKPGEDVDAITRATVSSDALAAAARETGRKLAFAALGAPTPPSERAAAADWPWALAVGAFFIAAFFARRGVREGWRILFLAASAGILGFWGGRYISIGDVGRLLLFQFPPFLDRLALYVLLLGAAAAAFVFGNLFCSWLCPFGAAAEILYKLPVPKLNVTPRYARRLGWLRVAVLVAVVAVVVASRRPGVAAYEPFDDLFFFAAAGWSLVFLVAVGAASVFHFRFFCRYLCVTGALLGEIAAAGRRAGKGVTGAGSCAVGALDAAGASDPALCLECGRCRRDAAP